MLNNIEKNNPFRVPENYFQNISSEIMAQIPEKEQKKKIVPLWKTITRWSAVAAAFVGVAFIGANYMDNSTTEENVPNTSNQEQLASIQNDYFLFVEDETSQSDYYDVFYSDQL